MNSFPRSEHTYKGFCSKVLIMSSKASSTVDVSLFKRGLDHKNRWKNKKVYSFKYNAIHMVIDGVVGL